MAIQAKVGTFNIPASDSTTIQLRGFGFQPKLTIFFWSGRNEATNTAGSANLRFGVGFAVSTTDRRCATLQSEDNVSPTNTDQYMSNVACIATIATDGTVEGLGDYTTDADGFDVVVDDAFEVAIRVSYLSLGGDSITNQETLDFIHNATTGAQNVTTTFVPTLAMLLSCNNGAGYGSVLAGGQLGFGAATGPSNEFICVMNTADTQTAGRAGSYGYGDEVLAELGKNNDPPIIITERAEFTEFQSSPANGFEINMLEASATRNVPLALLVGGNYVAGDFATKTDTTDIVISGLGFRPAAVMCVSVNRVESIQDASTSPGQFSIGVFTGPSSQVAHAIRENYAPNPSEAWSAIDYDQAYINLDATGAVVGLCKCKSMDADGFTMTCIDNADTVAAFVGYIAFGPGTAEAATFMNARRRRM